MMNNAPKIGKFSDDDERDLIEALENENAVFKSKLTSVRKKKFQDMAFNTMNVEREKITLRVSRNDLTRIKSLALQEGMPYQTLINSILHKAVS
jgi:predicted DNA binding CopG/RHH family protein